MAGMAPTRSLSQRPSSSSFADPYRAASSSNHKLRRVTAPLKPGAHHGDDDDQLSPKSKQPHSPPTRSSSAIAPRAKPPRLPLHAKPSSEYAADTVGLYQDVASADDLDLTSSGSRFDHAAPLLRPHVKPVPVDAHNSRRHSTRSANVVLQLMRATAGSIQGEIRYRRSPNHQWRDTHAFVSTERGSLQHRSPSMSSDEVLVRDLRCCRVHILENLTFERHYIRVTTHDRSLQIFLQPKDPQDLDTWFASLLCWQAVPLRQNLQRSASSLRLLTLQDSTGQLRDPPRSKPASTSASPSHSAATVKSGNAILMEYSVAQQSTAQDLDPSDRAALHPRVLCVLRANGQLTIQTFAERAGIATVELKHLPRSAIQRLDKSCFGRDFTLAIHPQYAQSNSCSRLRPLRLAFDSRESLETWFVLLRAFAAPELFGSQRLQGSRQHNQLEMLPGLDHSPASIFRVEHTIDLRVVRFKISAGKEAPYSTERVDRKGSLHPSTRDKHSFAAEICFDGQIRGRTPIRSGYGDAYWASNHTFHDLPSRPSTISVQIKQQTLQSSTAEVLYGEAVIDATDSELTEIFDGSLPVTDSTGMEVGEVNLSIRHRQEVILLEREYDQMSQLLEDELGHLTSRINEQLSPSTLNRLAECFLNVFHVSNQTENWLLSLIELELKGPPSQSTQQDANTSADSTSDAILLFRGNTLLTKALDLHMKRVGRAYLEDTLGPKMREIAEGVEDCEIDPNRLPAGADTQANFSRLVSLTTEVWELVRRSAYSCPPELSVLFRHIRACARKRFGASVPSVNYTSVSGFLFLRFFCAAILSPQLFGLLDEAQVIAPQAHRAFMLVAKALQGLANLSTFGNKEAWMAPMNAFCADHRQEFMDFVDTVCAGANATGPDFSSPAIRGSATDAVALSIIHRLPVHAREGFPSLPHLIDGPRNLANLVNIWLDNVGDSSGPTSRASVNSSTSARRAIDGDLARFHDMCLSLRQRTRVCLELADTIPDRVNPVVAIKWIGLAEQLEVYPGEFWRKDWSPSASLVDLPATSAGEQEQQQRTHTDSAISLSSDKERDSKHLDSPHLSKARTFLAFGWKTSSTDDKRRDSHVETPTPTRERSLAGLRRKEPAPSSQPPPTTLSVDAITPVPTSTLTPPSSLVSVATPRTNSVSENPRRFSPPRISAVAAAAADVHALSTGSRTEQARPKSIMSSTSARSGGGKSGKSKKAKSPVRNESDHAMRKLGFI